MPASLTSADVQRLQAAMTICLTPLEYPSVDQWARDLMSSVRTLVGADQSLLAVSLPGRPNWIAVQDAHGAAAAREYIADFVGLDSALLRRRRRLGLEVWHRDQLYRADELATSPVLNEWARPYKLFDAAGMSVDVPANEALVPALLHVYRDHETPEGIGERAILLLQLLLPSFRSALHMVREHARRAADLAGVLDTLGDGVVVFDASGRTLHRNPALVALLDGESLNGRRELEHRTATMADAILRRRDGNGGVRKAPVTGEATTASGRYRITATILRGSSLSTRPVAVIDVVPVHTGPRTDAELRAVFDLTPREIAVARFLATGASNALVAQSLGITTSTARHHTEAVLRKLGLHSRARVRQRLQRLPRPADTPDAAARSSRAYDDVRS